MKNLNQVLVESCQANFLYYKSKYGKKFNNMLNYSLIDPKDLVGGLSRYVGKGEDRYLLTQIFENCNADYRHIPEMLVLKYAEYFPREIVELVENRLNDWCIPWHKYLEEDK